MKKGIFWGMLILVVVVVAMFNLLANSSVDFSFNWQEFGKIIGVFVLPAIIVGLLGGALYHRGKPISHFIDKREYKLLSAKELNDGNVLLILCDLDGYDPEAPLLFRVKKDAIMDENGRFITDVCQIPKEFMVIKRYVATEDGPGKTVSRLLP